MIRNANLNDCTQLAQFDWQGELPEWTAEQFQSAYQSQHNVILIAENKIGEYQGFIVWQRVYDEMELHLIATLPAFRRQGVASKLLTQMFQVAKTHHVQRILLEVCSTNVAAQLLYMRHGFHSIALRKHYYHGSEDAVLMEKIC